MTKGVKPDSLNLKINLLKSPTILKDQVPSCKSLNIPSPCHSQGKESGLASLASRLQRPWHESEFDGAMLVFLFPAHPQVSVSEVTDDHTMPSFFFQNTCHYSSWWGFYCIGLIKYVLYSPFEYGRAPGSTSTANIFFKLFFQCWTQTIVIC